MSDSCLLSSTQNEMPINPFPEVPSTDDQSTNTGLINSLDSGIPDECSSGTGKVCSFNLLNNTYLQVFYFRITSKEILKNPLKHMLNILRILDIKEKSQSMEVNTTLKGAHNNSRNIQNPQYEMLKKEFDNKQSELKSLKLTHGKLQKVLTEKGSELSQAVRKEEVNEREANKLNHKLEEVRTQQQHEKQGKAGKTTLDRFVFK